MSPHTSATVGFLRNRLEFPFPAAHVHDGIPLSNGTFGALVWGGGPHVRITINRADYWDRRGGLSFGPEATYANLKRWLSEGDEERLRAVFEGRWSEDEATPPHPTRLPMGRVDLRLPDGWSIAGGGLSLYTGEAELELEGTGAGAKLRLVILRDAPVLCVRLTGVEGSAVRVVSQPPDAPEVVEYQRRYRFPKPQTIDLGEFGGWVQELPAGGAMAAAWLAHAANGGLLVYVASVYGADPVDARRAALQALEDARAEGYTPATLRSFRWQGRWWEKAAAVELPDPTAELLYSLGMYKLSGLSVPGGPAATLQGPWVEEHRLPPWSSDYHFNVNVQECYWPCYAGNHLEALDPLVEMLASWRPKLRENARVFAEVEDGLQLPHSTDDRGTAMTGFWTGFVDHGSTAWTAQLLWQRYCFEMDRQFLADAAYPLMKGALRVYEAMLEDDGRNYSLPVGVSPEFGGAGLAAWGRNASFQLAAIHFLCRALLQASRILEVDEQERDRWSDIDARLPIGAVGGGPDQPELLLWEGQPLTESHRHHSHLAGIYPFDVLEYHPERANDLHRRLVRNSLRRLTRMGTGLWTGWCLPWAAILHARAGDGEKAALLLESFRRFFMTDGYASTHDARFPGFTLMDGRPDIMQVEAAEGAAAAVLEMLAHTAGGVLRLFHGVPRAWLEVRFRGVRAEGAFLLDAEREGGQTRRVEVRSEAGQPLRLVNPFAGGAAVIRRDGGRALRMQGRLLEIPTSPGEILVLESA